jgi:hypothetical protein
VIWCDTDMGVPARAAGALRGGAAERGRERGGGLRTYVHRFMWAGPRIPTYMATHCLGFRGGVHTEPGGHVCCAVRCGAVHVVVRCCACAVKTTRVAAWAWLAVALFMVF